MNASYIASDVQTIVENVAAIYSNMKVGAVAFVGSGVFMVAFDLQVIWDVLARVYFVNWVHVLGVCTVLVLGIVVQFVVEFKGGVRGRTLFFRAAISFVSRASIYGLWLVIGVVVSAMIREQSAPVAAWFLLGSFLSVAVVEGAVVMEKAGTPIGLWFKAIGAAKKIVDGEGDVGEASEALDEVTSAVIGTARPKIGEAQPPSADAKT